MVIRRIREHVTAHNWFAVGDRLCIVVLGVFLGLQVNNWNQAASRHSKAATIARGLSANWTSTPDSIAEQATITGRSGKWPAALAALEKPADPSARLPHSRLSASQIDYDACEDLHLRRNGCGWPGFDRLGDEELQDFASDYYLTLTPPNRSFPDCPPIGTITVSHAHACRRRSAAMRRRFFTVSAAGRRVRLPDRCTIALDPALEAAQAARRSCEGTEPSRRK